jgi:translation initiation factor IF-2
MAKVRVYQLAKDLKVQSALILELLDRMGEEVKSDLSTVDEPTAELVRIRITSALEVEKERLAHELEVESEIAEVPATPADEPVHAEEPAPTEVVVEPPLETGEPLAAKPLQEEKPAAVPPAATVERPRPAPVRKKAPVAAKSAVVRPESAAAAAAAVAAASAIAGKTARKPRVFPARRVPVPSTLVRPKPAAPPVPPSGARAGVPTPGRPAGPPSTGLPGRGALPPKKRRKKDKKERRSATPPSARPPKELPPVPAEITLTEGVTVKELAEKLNRKSKDVIAKLISRGVLATINQPLEPNIAIDVAKEFGSEAKIITFEEEARRSVTPPALEISETAEADQSGNLRQRPPVVTVMGHVDHGKTSLLDALRGTYVVDSEAGGITQHIGAYQVEARGRKITFLDTPGHEAFTMMRARGAKSTDIVVLVVAADDGVKPQTLEAIDHARAAGVPMVVAINKIDTPGSNPVMVKQQLAERELVVEEYGGDVVSCEVSAKQRTGLDELLEMILLVADMKELKADPEKPAKGVVLEARLDRARGVLATVLVLEGTLKPGDPFIAGSASGKVRAMTDNLGHRVTVAGPSTPVEVMGFADEPGAGDSFQSVPDEAKVRQIAAFRREKVREQQQKASARRTLQSLANDIASGAVKELPILLKADVQGSLEALRKALGELPSDRVRVSILRSSIGAITQADVLLAAASNAIVVGFNVRPDKAARARADEETVELLMYTVIYDLVDDIKKAMVGLLEPTFKEVVLGQAKVRQLFRVPKLGTIAGCYITDGKVTRNSEVRLLRDNVVIYTGKIGSLRRFKDDVSEVKQGYECGIGIAGYNDLKDDDVIESFVMEKVMAKSL